MAWRIPATKLLGRRGFTLAESLLASVVLASAVTAISLSLGVSYQHRQIDRQQVAAAALARQTGETVAARRYASLSALATELTGDVIHDGMTLTRSVTLAGITSAGGQDIPAGDLTQLVITVTPSAGGTPVKVVRWISIASWQ